MSRIVLVTGGARSGKSAWAQHQAEGGDPSRVYLATSIPQDDEMRARVERHREMRRGRGWATIEAPLDLAAALRGAVSQYRVVLVDCLTLWIANSMYEAERVGTPLDEETVAAGCLGVIEACKDSQSTVLFVTGEVGLGIVPDNPAARRFRDLLGICNQTIADLADEVMLLVCGQPLRIK